MWSGFIRQNEEALRRVQGERLGKDMTKRQKKSLTRIIIAAVLMIILKFLPVEGWLKFVLYMVPGSWFWVWFFKGGVSRDF